MKDDYTTNSHYLTDTFLLKGWENVLFELRNERVNICVIWQVVDSVKEKTIGKLDFPLARLLNDDNMTFEQPFPLQDSGHNSTLTCTFMLKVGYRIGLYCFQR